MRAAKHARRPGLRALWAGVVPAGARATGHRLLRAVFTAPGPARWP